MPSTDVYLIRKLYLDAIIPTTFFKKKNKCIIKYAI